jgi:hypothetical protein
MAQLIGSPLVVVVAALVTLLAIAVPVRRMLIVYRGADSRRPVDVSHLAIEPTAELAALLARLVALGFRRVGETSLRLPGLQLVQLTETGSPVLTGPAIAHQASFVLVDDSGTIVAEAVHVESTEPLLSLTTTFADGSVVETMHPLGEAIDDPDFHSGRVAASVGDALVEQRAIVGRWPATHGAPWTVATMADHLRADANYRRRFARRMLRGPLVRRQLVPAAIMAALVIAVAGVLLARWPA